MYPTIDKNERAQLEEVFGLTGGELADGPIRYAVITADYGYPRSYPPVIKIERRWARYYYDGYPEYADDLRSLERRHGGSYMTIVKDCLLGEPPQTIYMHGQRWRRVKVFRSSGETECPMRIMHECMGHKDHPTEIEGGRMEPGPDGKMHMVGGRKVSIVTKEEAEVPEGGKIPECPLCGEYVGDAHKYIYLGDGWCEIVYRRRD